MLLYIHTFWRSLGIPSNASIFFHLPFRLFILTFKYFQDLAQSCQSPSLNLAQCTATAEESNSTNHTRCRQHLEKVPAGVVQEENALHCENAAKEKGVRDGVTAHGFSKVVEVGAKKEPGADKYWQSGNNSKGEDRRDDLGWRLGVVAENVVDLRKSTVAQRCIWSCDNSFGVTSNLDVQDFAVVRCGGAKRGNDDLGLERLLGCEKLVWEVLLCLRPSAFTLLAS